MPDIQMPDGQVVRFPDTMSETAIRGLIAQKYPREVGASGDAKPLADRDTTGHYGFDGTNIPGYDPKSGIVSGGSIDDNLGQEYRTGIRQAIESTAGFAGDIGPMLGRAGGAAASKLGLDPQTQDMVSGALSKAVSTGLNPIGAVLPYDNASTTQQIQQNITDPLLGKSDEPLTEKGQAARTTGNFAAGSFGPGGPIRKTLSMLLPAAGSEAGGYLAKGTPYEPYARFAGALLGGGLAVPKVGGKPIAGAATDLGTRAQDMTRVIKRMQQDGMTPAQIQSRLDELGPGATLMDVGPNLRQEGQRIYAQGGRGRGVIDETLAPREATANQRIRSDIDASLGPAPVPSHIDANLAASQNDVAQGYAPLFANARAVNTQAIANDLESAAVNLRGPAQTAAQRVRRFLDIPGTTELDPNPRALHATREAIDGLLKDESNPQVIRQLTMARQSVDRALTQAVPGVKDVDAQFAELARQRGAVTEGQSALDSGRTAPRPVELSERMQQGALPQGTQVGPSAVPLRLREGARADLDRIIGTNANDRVALQRVVKGEGDWNRDKLVTLFGQDRADRLFSILDRESTFAQTHNRTIMNSATAERLPEGSSGPSVKDAFSVGGPKAVAYSGLVKGVETVMDKIRGAAAASRDERVARILSSTDAQRVATALLRANGGKQLPQHQIESAVRALLLTSGASSQSAN